MSVINDDKPCCCCGCDEESQYYEWNAEKQKMIEERMEYICKRAEKRENYLKAREAMRKKKGKWEQVFEDDKLPQND